MVLAVIFDLDDTLQDWPASIERALTEIEADVPVHARASFAPALRSALDRLAYVRRDGMIVNRHHWMLLADPVPFWRAALPEIPDEDVQRLANRFRSLLWPVAFGDAAPALRVLRPRHKLGVLSNSPRSEEHLAELGLREYFDCVVIAGETHRKPHARAFERVCAELGVDGREALYVGDSIASDVEGAIAAGLRAVWIDRWNERYPLPAGVERIETLAELPDLAALD